LPVPGGPYSSTPLESRAERLELLRVLEELLDLVQLLDGLINPATSRNVIFGESTDIRLARDLPNDITFEPPPWTWFIRNSQNTIRITTGSR